jgi:phosphatidate cytidylyltransferase
MTLSLLRAGDGIGTLTVHPMDMLPVAVSFDTAAAVPVLVTVGALLGAALPAVLVAERRRGPAGGGELLRRWRTWAMIAPCAALAVLAGPVGVAALAAALAVQGGREFARLAGLDRWHTAALVAAGFAFPVATLLGDGVLRAAPLVVLLAATTPALLRQDTRDGARQAAVTALGMVYLPLMLAHLVLISGHPRGGAGLLAAVLLAVGLSDVGAFITGRAMGGPRLAPRLSPGKTWAGLAGNLAGAALGMVLLRAVLPDELSTPTLIALTAVIAAGAAWGDLLESLIKRSAGAKDAGGWLPGFGGLLDRIDSLIVAAPLVWAVLELGS